MIGNHLEPFKFWCQKVLPNVYDDSLSYYEYLCKLNEYLNEVIGQINTLTDEMETYESDVNAQWNDYKTGLNQEWLEYKTDLTNQWTTTKNYIDNYFTNLDVQTEINNKLDQMVLDGTLNDLIRPYVDGEITANITAWLNEHVDPVGSAVIVDNTLTIQGAAADANKTGAIGATIYNTSATYRINDYCLYNGIIYRCISNINTPEEFTSGHWTAVRLGNDIKDLNNITLKNNMVLALGDDATSVLSDLNNAKKNTMYIFMLNNFATQKPSNLPVNFTNDSFIVSTLCNEYATTSSSHNEYYNQYLIDYISGDVIAKRTKNNGTWESWNLVNYTMGCEQIICYQNTTRDVLSNLNNAKENTWYIILTNNASYLPDNVPSGVPNAFKVITFSGKYNDQGYWPYKEQFIVGTNSLVALYKRSYINGAWTAWTKQQSDEYNVGVKRKVAFTTDISNVISDLNNADDNTMYKIMASDVSQLPSNVPTNCPRNIIVFTMSQGIEQNGTYKMQYIFNQNLVLLFRRQNYNGWSQWYKISNEYIVDINGGGDFTSLTSAVANAHDGDVIYVRKGVYDNEKVKAWNKNITIIGEDKHQTIIKNGDNDYYNPPIEMSVGRLENLTFEQYDGNGGEIHTGSPSAGYALHIEDNSLTNAKFSISNCIFKSALNHGVGIGLRPNCYVEFDNCTMYSTEKSGVFVHDCATGAVGTQTINFTNCVITTDDAYSAQFNSLKYSGTTVYVGMEHNIFANDDGTTPLILAQNVDGYGTATSPIGDFYNLINFFKMKTNYGNNISDTNYTPV